MALMGAAVRNARLHKARRGRDGGARARRGGRRGARAGGERARGGRRGDLPRRRARRDPPLEPGGGAVMGRPADEVVRTGRSPRCSPAGRRSRPQIPVGEGRASVTLPLELDGRRGLALVRRRPERRGRRLRVPRPDERARARGGQERVRRHRLPRAAHPDGGHLRRGADAPHARTSTSRRTSAGPARDHRQPGRAPDPDHRGGADREPARPGRAAGGTRARRRRRAGQRETVEQLVGQLPERTPSSSKPSRVCRRRSRTGTGFSRCS